MKYRLLSSLLACAILLCGTGCGDKQESTGDSSAGGSRFESDNNQEIVVDTKLYTIGDAFSKAFDALGYDPNKTPEENKAIVNGALGQYGLSLTTLPDSLTGELNTNPAISTILSLANINNEDVDWSTRETFYAHPIFSSSEVPVVLSSDRELFLDTLKLSGIDSYAMALTESDLPAIEPPDFSIISTMLSKDARTNLFDREIAKIKMVNEYTTHYCPDLSSYSFYEYVYFNGISSVSFYPAMLSNGDHVVMTDKVKGKDLYLWQAYTIYYLIELYGQYGVIPQDAIIDNTETGVSMWWALGDSNTLLLTVSSIGNICITVSTDDRYAEYNSDVDNSPSRPSSVVDPEIASHLYNEWAMEEDDILYMKKLCEYIAPGELDAKDEYLAVAPVFKKYFSDYSDSNEFMGSRYKPRNVFEGLTKILCTLNSEYDYDRDFASYAEQLPERGSSDEAAAQLEFTFVQAVGFTPPWYPHVYLYASEYANGTAVPLPKNVEAARKATYMGEFADAMGRENLSALLVEAMYEVNGLRYLTPLEDITQEQLEEMFIKVPYFTEEEKDLLRGMCNG